MSSAYPTTVGAMGEFEIYVRADDAERARELLAAAEEDLPDMALDDDDMTSNIVRLPEDFIGKDDPDNKRFGIEKKYFGVEVPPGRSKMRIRCVPPRLPGGKQSQPWCSPLF